MDDLENDTIELILLRRANAAQDSVLRRKQQNIAAQRRIIKGLCWRMRRLRRKVNAVRLDADSERSARKTAILHQLELQEELGELRAENAELRAAQDSVLRRKQAELDALHAENAELRAALDKLNSNWRVNLTEYK